MTKLAVNAQELEVNNFYTKYFANRKTIAEVEDRFLQISEAFFPIWEGTNEEFKVKALEAAANKRKSEF